jgi:CheY-like chemotaxis protein
MARSSPAAQSHNHIVLVVEDNVLVRIALADALRRQGLDIIQAANAGEVLRVLSRCAHIELVLTDIELENSSMDGLELATTSTKAIQTFASRGSGPSSSPMKRSPSSQSPIRCVQSLIA